MAVAAMSWYSRAMAGIFLAAEQRWLALPRIMRRCLRPLISALSLGEDGSWARLTIWMPIPAPILPGTPCFVSAPLRRQVGWGNWLMAQSAAFAAFPVRANRPCWRSRSGNLSARDLMTLLDRTTMASSVEGRVPFGSSLGRNGLALPPDMRTPRGGKERMEQAMAADFLPDVVLTAPKQGFLRPVPSLVRWCPGPYCPPGVDRKNSAAARLVRSRWPGRLVVATSPSSFPFMR